jgi:eukaryotic-like serine/threonine-protein kinase
MNSNGAGGKELLLPVETSDPGMWPTSWSPDGRFILYVTGNTPNPIQDVWVLPLAGDRKPRLFVHNAFDGQFSADGRWVAYTSIESDKLSIYVVPFDAAKVLNTGPGAEISAHDKTQISTSYGSIARWRGDGREIFYLGSKDKEMMAAEVDGRGNSFEARTERTLFRAAAIAEKLGGFDVTPDGKRFVTATQRVNNLNTPLTLVVNWTARLGNRP